MEEKSIYQKLGEVEHVLKRPDTYIGNIETEETEDFIFRDDKIMLSNIKVNPGLIRLFLEILSNAIDNIQRSKKRGVEYSSIKIDIKEDGWISIWNDGCTIPIEKQVDDMYNPELIFGNLRSGENFNDEEERKAAGRNGLGGKLANIFSKCFIIETYDYITKKYYTQKWENHMGEKSEPVVIDWKKWDKKTTDEEWIDKTKGFTKISWLADLEYFNSKYTKSTLGLFRKYAYVCAVSTKCKVFLNNEKLKVKDMPSYTKLYLEDKFSEKEIVNFKHGDFEIAVIPSNEFRQVSSVNGMPTFDGGLHVDLWLEKIFRPLVDKVNGEKKEQKEEKKTKSQRRREALTKKKKKKIDRPKININDVKKYFTIFINANIDKPRFTSQSKTKLCGPSSVSDIEVKVPRDIIYTISKWEWIDKIEDVIRMKQITKLKKTEASKRGIKRVEGLDKANLAGKSDCILTVCEGLSAKTAVISGLKSGIFGKAGRDYIGVYPIRGKFLNSRNANFQRFLENKEVNGLKKSLEIQHGIDYTTEIFNKLPYKKLVFITDADDDGKHIIGLLINFFEHSFPTLLKRPFLYYMKTPIIKVELKKKIFFYSQNEADSYINEKNVNEKYIKRHKGLGTLNSKDMSSTFGKKMVRIDKDDNSHKNLVKAFDSKASDRRKKWLVKYVPGVIVENRKSKKDENLEIQTISEFIDNDLIEHSITNCKRMIPHLMDGMKESHRKIFYTCYTGKMNKLIKVEQLVGKVLELTCYHYGAKNLEDTIKNMMQRFVGSNNLPLLVNEGQSGSRTFNGQDGAAARYLFTKLESYVEDLFPRADIPILTKLTDNGSDIEYSFMLPIIPVLFCNKNLGIGTAFKCDIPQYNPLDLINWITWWINNKDVIFDSSPELIPWWRRFTGEVEMKGKSVVTKGTLKQRNDSYKITELPIGMSIDNYKMKLEDLQEDKEIKNFDNNSSENFPLFKVTSDKELSLGKMGLISKRMNTNNIVVFDYLTDTKSVIKKFETINDAMERFCSMRYSFYQKRKKYQINELKRNILYIDNKMRFILEIINETLEVRGVKRSIIDEELDDKKYDRKTDIKKEKQDEDDDEEDEKEGGTFNYLLRMPIWNLTLEKIEKLKKEKKREEDKLELLESKTESTIWVEELDKFKKSYEKWLENEIERDNEK